MFYFIIWNPRQPFINKNFLRKSQNPCLNASRSWIIIQYPYVLYTSPLPSRYPRPQTNTALISSMPPPILDIRNEINSIRLWFVCAFNHIVCAQPKWFEFWTFKVGRLLELAQPARLGRLQHQTNGVSNVSKFQSVRAGNTELLS